jgi:flavin reductase (DIM6/NTAB) family NADH-FMN oxidoreductase RutF
MLVSMTEQVLDFRRSTVDARQLRNALGCFATGVAVVTTRTAENKLEGLTVNSFSSVSLDPPLVLWSLRLDSPSLESFRSSGWFAVNVLGAHQHTLCRHFATRAVNKFADVPHEFGLGGCPILIDSLARFECSTERTIEGGDHVIFIGRVERATYRKGTPLIFSAGQYCVPEMIVDLVPVDSKKAAEGDIR